VAAFDVPLVRPTPTGRQGEFFLLTLDAAARALVLRMIESGTSYQKPHISAEFSGASHIFPYTNRSRKERQYVSIFFSSVCTKLRGVPVGYSSGCIWETVSRVYSGVIGWAHNYWILFFSLFFPELVFQLYCLRFFEQPL
jgi:hypothetical protein